MQGTNPELVLLKAGAIGRTDVENVQASRGQPTERIIEFEAFRGLTEECPIGP